MSSLMLTFKCSRCGNKIDLNKDCCPHCNMRLTNIEHSRKLADKDERSAIALPLAFFVGAIALAGGNIWIGVITGLIVFFVASFALKSRTRSKDNRKVQSLDERTDSSLHNEINALRSMGASSSRPQGTPHTLQIQKKKEEECHKKEKRAGVDTNLKCPYCGSIYRIGEDTTISTPEDVLKEFPNLSGKFDMSRPDLMTHINTDDNELRRNLNQKSLEKMGAINNVLRKGQTRYWYCSKCENENNPCPYSSALHAESPRESVNKGSLHTSQIADKLRCPHCNKIHGIDKWPMRGDLEAVYFGATAQSEYNLKTTCPHCNKDWYIYWYENPGPIGALDFSSADNNIRNEGDKKAKLLAEIDQKLAILDAKMNGEACPPVDWQELRNRADAMFKKSVSNMEIRMPNVCLLCKSSVTQEILEKTGGVCLPCYKKWWKTPINKPDENK